MVKVPIGDLMKKLSILFLLAFFIAGNAWADYLTCDPQPGVTMYQLQFETGNPVATDALAGGVLKYDLSAYSIGTHTVKGKSCNLVGCSDWSAVTTITLMAPLPTAPQNLKVTK